MDHALETLEELGNEWDLFEQEMAQAIARHVPEENQKAVFELMDMGRRIFWDAHNIHLAA